MKIKSVLLLLVFLLPLISAVQIDMKSDFSQGETLLAKITGNFVTPVQEENVLFYEGHVRISIVPSVRKIGNEFYVYAQSLGKSEGNYSLVLSDVSYFEGSQLKNDDISKKFVITNKSADFLINQGVVQTDDDFFIEVENLKDEKIVVESRLGNYSENGDGGAGFFDALFGGDGEVETDWIETTVNPYETKKIYFTVGELNESVLKEAMLRAADTLYEVPVFLKSSEETPKEKSLEIQPAQSTISISTDSETSRYFYLRNSGEADLENITLSVSDGIKKYVSITNETINLNENSTRKIEINISSTEEDFVQGRITATDGEVYSYLDLSLNFSKSYVPSGNESDSLFPTCEELDGEFCSSNEECNGDTEDAEDGVCCLGTCEPVKKSSAGKIVGWVLVVAIVGVLAWFFFKKFKKAKSSPNLLKAAKAKPKK